MSNSIMFSTCFYYIDTMIIISFFSIISIFSIVFESITVILKIGKIKIDIINKYKN